MHKQFRLISGPDIDRWKHKTQDYWIVFYSTLKDAGKPCFIAYRPIVPTKGRDPWTVNNRRVGEFKTLDKAMAFAEAAP